mmetsp:Transcript_13517/g.29260  ORF Transcript_13517/g.29260 Transcript_13517/m.29260 type:complete len:100 (+) Transcript_13517:1-300(+)
MFDASWREKAVLAGFGLVLIGWKVFPGVTRAERIACLLRGAADRLFVTATDPPDSKRNGATAIAVENVLSDDEDDEIRELRSARRNRLPGPGQWMEPVE